jgi:hypothetical protein
VAGTGTSVGAALLANDVKAAASAQEPEIRTPDDSYKQYSESWRSEANR